MSVSHTFVVPSGPGSRTGVVGQSESQSPSRVHPVMGLLLAALFALVVPLAIMQGNWGAFSPAVLVQSCVTALAGGMLGYTLAMRRPAMLQLVVYLFTYIWMGLAPLVQLGNGVLPIPAAFPVSLTFSTSLLVLTGLLAYIVGTHVPSIRPREQGLLARVYRRELVPIRVAVVVVVAIGLFVIFVPKLGGVSAFFSSREQAAEARQNALAGAGQSGGATQVLYTWALSVTAFWALLGLVLIGRRRESRTGWWWAGLLITIAMNVIVNNPISRPRYWAGTVLVGLIFTIPRLRKPRPFRIAALLLIATVMLAFPYASYFRYKNTAKTAQHSVVSVQSQFSGNDYDAFAMTEAGLQYVKEHGHQPNYLLTDALFFVPRYLWAGKAGDTGVVISEERNFTLTNRSAPLWLETYLWGGAAATIAVFLLLGVAHRRLDDAHGDAPHPTVAEIGPAFVPVLAVFALFYLRGSLLPGMAPLFFLVALPLLMSRRERGDVVATDQVSVASTKSLPSESLTRVISS